MAFYCCLEHCKCTKSHLNHQILKRSIPFRNHVLESFSIYWLLWRQRKYLKKGKFVVPTYTRNKQTVPIYTFYEYSPTKKGLYYFCRKDDLLTSDFLFYTKLEEFLKEFCLTHGIERMIFPCIEYGKPWFWCLEGNLACSK